MSADSSCSASCGASVAGDGCYSLGPQSDVRVCTQRKKKKKKKQVGTYCKVLNAKQAKAAPLHASNPHMRRPEAMVLYAPAATRHLTNP